MYKKLRIIFLSLAIISMVFTLVYKVGHCADSSGSSSDTSYYPFASDVPLPVSSDVGFRAIGNVDISHVVDKINSGDYSGYPFNEHGFNNINALLFYESYQSDNQIEFLAYSDLYLSSFEFPEDLNTGSVIAKFASLNNYYIRVTYNIDTDTIVGVRSDTGVKNLSFYPLGNSLSWVSSVISGQINIYQVNKNQNILNYPVYLRDHDLSLSGVVHFSDSVNSSGGSGHSKGGAIADISESIDESTDLPQVDDNAPSDSSSVPSWLQKILTALKSINSNLRGVGVSIVSGIDELIDKISEFCENVWDWIKDKFNNFIDSINGVISDYNDLKDTDSDDVITALDNSILFGGFSTFKGYLSTLDSTFNVAASENAPVWRIPLNGTVLYSSRLQYIEIDFSFFDRFHDVWIAFISLVFGFGMIFHILKSIPGIFHGLPGSHDVNNLTQPTMHTPPQKTYNTFVSGDLIKNYRSK